MDNIKIRKRILWIIGLLFMFSLIGCQKVIVNPLTIPEYVKKEPNYLTEIIVKVDLYDSKTLYAKVHPIQEKTYSFLTSGYIERILPIRGEEVSKGQLLATLNNSDLEKQARDMEITYQIEKLKIEKFQKIYDTTGNGKYDLDIALLDFKITQYQYDKLQEEVDDLNIYATFDGVVDSIKVIVNKYVTPSNGIVTVVDESDTFISFTDPDIPGLIVGSVVNLYITKDEIVEATVSEIKKKEEIIIIDTKTEAIRLKDIGQLFKVEIILDRVNQTIAIKKGWLHEAAGREFVYVLENGVMTEREISKGKELGGWIEILIGLQEGDEVIVNTN
ncbi:MAG: efflux RND transporter periplasmic adaptor subunit [Clostridiales bacterium]|nr:efflux RND transporter periplasmic adaptor subunit [Clostridiales bacterium]